MALVDFLETTHAEGDPAAALRVLRAFKACEGEDEFLGTAFAAWAKLEQLEEYLEHLVEGASLKGDTVAEIERRRGA